MVVVADSTILIVLLRAGQLALLRQLYGTIVIPARVWQEVVGRNENRPGTEGLLRARADGWVIIGVPQGTIDPATVPRFARLHAGEQQAILVALDHQPAILLVDERDAFQIVTEVFSRYIDAAALPDVMDECIALGLLNDRDVARLYAQANYRPASAVQRYRAEHPNRRPAQPR
jgi:predicted nucleic acid-binding protein